MTNATVEEHVTTDSWTPQPNYDNNVCYLRKCDFILIKSEVFILNSNMTSLFPSVKKKQNYFFVLSH